MPDFFTFFYSLLTNSIQVLEAPLFTLQANGVVISVSFLSIGIAALIFVALLTFLLPRRS